MFKQEKYCKIAAMKPIHQRYNHPRTPIVGFRPDSYRKRPKPEPEPLSPASKTERYYRAGVENNNAGWAKTLQFRQNSSIFFNLGKNHCMSI